MVMVLPPHSKMKSAATAVENKARPVQAGFRRILTPIATCAIGMCLLLGMSGGAMWFRWDYGECYLSARSACTVTLFIYLFISRILTAPNSAGFFIMLAGILTTSHKGT